MGSNIHLNCLHDEAFLNIPVLTAPGHKQLTVTPILNKFGLNIAGKLYLNIDTHRTGKSNGRGAE
jgi:hypothetical protein